MSRMGKLGGTALPPGTWMKICTATSEEFGSYSVVIANTNADAVNVPARIKVALKDDAVGNPTATDILEWDSQIKNYPLRIEGLAMGDGNSLWVQSNIANVSAIVYGSEELITEQRTGGKLAGQDLPVATWTDLYLPTEPDTLSIVGLVITNRNLDAGIGTVPPARVSVALKGVGESGNPGIGSILEWEVPVRIPPFRLEGTQMGPGDVLSVYTDTANLSAVVYGLKIKTA